MARFETPDGVTLYFEEAGAGEPILFVHEFGGDYRSWYRQLSALSQRARCVAYSSRGFYPSAIPTNRDQYGQAQATGDLLALMDHLELDQAHLVGTSMGSFTSLDFALTHPDRVKSLTLVGNSSGPRDAAERTRYRQDWVGHEIRLREAQGGDGAVAVLQSDPAYRSLQRNDAQGWTRYADNLRGQSPEGAIHILSTLHWNRRSLFEDKARLMAYSQPVLLVTGDEDYYLVGETNTFLSDALPDATWHRFEGTGHLVNIERATEFNALLTEHIGRAVDRRVQYGRQSD